MILYPAIDLKDGQCVRLLRGDMSSATIFSDSAVEQARIFSSAGAEWLHVVDLNGAFAGASVNRGSVLDILGAVDIPVQLGGGIRSLADIDFWFDSGVERVILGTVAVTDFSIVERACGKYGERIAVSLDSRDDLIAINGWAEMSDIKLLDMALRLQDVGVGALIHTDIERDGAMMGVNFSSTESLARAVDIPVIASGGVTNLFDVRRAISGGLISGLISGRALYDGSLDLVEALSLC